MFQSSSSLDSETLDDPFPSGSPYVAATHQFLRENFQRLAALISSFTSDFLAFSDFQHKIFFLLASWLCFNVFVIFLTWYLYREKITDLLTNPRFVPAVAKKDSKEKKKKSSSDRAAEGANGVSAKGSGDSSKKNKDDANSSSSRGNASRRRSTPNRSRPESRGRTRQRTPIRTRSISSTESRQHDRSESRGRKQR